MQPITNKSIKVMLNKGLSGSNEILYREFNTACNINLSEHCLDLYLSMQTLQQVTIN